MARFILVHGAYHGGWCWEHVVPRLKARGHQVWAPDLPGMGEDASSGLVATLDEWAQFLAGGIVAGTEPAILVGHSRGGIVISRTAELVPHRLTGLVYLAAVLAGPGVTMADALEFSAASPESIASIAASADGQTTSWTSGEAAKTFFYNETDPAIAERAFARLCPEPIANLHLPLRLTAARYGRVPRAYIETLRDRVVRIDVQRRMVAAQPASVSTIDTDHSPFYSRPEELAETLQAIASRWASSAG